MKDILIAARAKIADAANWTQNALARDAKGCAVHGEEDLDGRDARACQWCAIGAVQAVSNFESAAVRALNIAATALYGRGGIADVNDEIDHAAVLACFDKAIGDAT
jgi:hypothetical protein